MFFFLCNNAFILKALNRIYKHYSNFYCIPLPSCTVLFYLCFKIIISLLCLDLVYLLYSRLSSQHILCLFLGLVGTTCQSWGTDPVKPGSRQTWLNPLVLHYGGNASLFMKYPPHFTGERIVRWHLFAGLGLSEDAIAGTQCLTWHAVLNGKDGLTRGLENESRTPPS